MEGTGRVTIRDVAARAGVSIATVHLALASKPGPKEETRRQVIETAEELGYCPNSVASSLKRGVTRIAAVLPALTESNRYYYAPIWQGVRAFSAEVKDFNVELEEIPYTNGDSVTMPREVIAQVRGEPKLSGLIVLGDIEAEAKPELRSLGLPIVLVNSDAPEVGRICCVQAENYLIGRTMGEILSRLTPKGGNILICAGDENTSANVDSTRGAEDFLTERDPERRVFKIHYQNDMDALYRQVTEYLSGDAGIAGCCSMTARGSVQLARALTGLGLAGRLPAIGSDVFTQNLRYLAQGVFLNLMFKNPFAQGHMAAEKLFDHIIRSHAPERDIFFIKGEVVFSSSASMYESEGVE